MYALASPLKYYSREGSMNNPIMQLYPQPGRERPLKGTYLAHDVRRFAPDHRVFVYANFVSSLDGRIAVRNICYQP
jgi:hypothetical protein